MSWLGAKWFAISFVSLVHIFSAIERQVYFFLLKWCLLREFFALTCINSFCYGIFIGCLLVAACGIFQWSFIKQIFIMMLDLRVRWSFFNFALFFRKSIFIWFLTCRWAPECIMWRCLEFDSVWEALERRSYCCFFAAGQWCGYWLCLFDIGCLHGRCRLMPSMPWQFLVLSIYGCFLCWYVRTGHIYPGIWRQVEYWNYVYMYAWSS